MSYNNQNHVAKVIRWRESLSTLSDQQFFDLFRMYLGEIKTPYNKQNLIEQLSAILRKEENKEKIISLLSYQDILILASLNVFEAASFTQIKLFLHDSISSYDLEVHLQNLEERLLVYRSIDKVTEKQVYIINPLLEEALAPYIGAELLFPEGKIVKKDDQAKDFCLNSQVLASVYSFVFQYPELCKLDGSLKKRFAQMVPDVFPHYCENFCLEKLLAALKNLGLFKLIDNQLQVEHEMWMQFALLSTQEQYAYISTASVSYLPRASLVSVASTLLSIITSLGKGVYTKKILKRIAFVYFENSFSIKVSKPTKLRTLLQQGQGKNEMLDFNSANLIDSIIEYGFLETLGFDDEDERLYSVRPLEELSETKKLLHLDSGFFVSILPGLPLKSLLSLAKTMDLGRCDTILSFEITKQSITRAFESGMSLDELYELFKTYSVHELPQNFYHAMEDWYSNFNSGSLYKGFVLHVNEDKVVLVENNSVLKNRLVHKLAPGIYLIDFANEEEAKALVQESGLDFIGRAKTLTTPSSNLPLVALRNDVLQNTIELSPLEKNQMKVLQKESLQKELQDYLVGMEITKEQREDLSLRIKKKIIFSKEQIRPDSVRYVKTEAKGIDFLGKIAIVEQAMASSLSLEIRYEASDKEKKKVFVGKAIQIEKFTNDALIHLEVEEKKEPIQLSIGGASLVKLLRTSFVF